jgi:hypothetical protein
MAKIRERLAVNKKDHTDFKQRVQSQGAEQGRG